MTRVLLNKQRTQLHDILLSCGVDPAVTKWTNDGKGWTRSGADTLEVGLCHFLFNPDSDGRLSVHFKPSLDGGASHGLVNQFWPDVLVMFEHWAHLVRDELDHDDPWAQYAAYLPPERLGGSTDNSPFTHSEAEHLAETLRTFRAHIKKQLPEYEEVAAQFDPQFERLTAQAKQGAGRIDWSNQFVGMLISLCMALALDSATASALWKVWIQLIDRLLTP